MVWVCEKKMSLWYTIRDSPFTSPSSAKAIHVYHGMACSIFALSLNVSIMQITSTMEECEDWAGNTSCFSSTILSQQSQNKQDKQEQHS